MVAPGALCWGVCATDSPGGRKEGGEREEGRGKGKGGGGRKEEGKEGGGRKERKEEREE